MILPPRFTTTFLVEDSKPSRNSLKDTRLVSLLCLLNRFVSMDCSIRVNDRDVGVVLDQVFGRCSGL